jgi:hypothetical protein
LESSLMGDALLIACRLLAETWLALTLQVGAPTAASPGALRAIGPPLLDPTTDHLIRVETLPDSASAWQLADPAKLAVDIDGPAEWLSDPSGQPVNPLTLRPRANGQGPITLRIRYGDAAHEERFSLGAPATQGKLALHIPATAVQRAARRLDGFGVGMTSLDDPREPADEARIDELLGWRFQDVQARFLRVPIRPDFEPHNDNGDWQRLDLAEFDFAPGEGGLAFVRRAQAVNPQLQIIAHLTAPPSWLQDENAGDGYAALRDSEDASSELAEYAYAWLRHAANQGIEVHYLGWFGDPDGPAGPARLPASSASRLCQVLEEATACLRQLVAADPAGLRLPSIVFPEVVGLDSLTHDASYREAFELRRAALREYVDVWGVHADNAAGHRRASYADLRQLPAVGEKPIWMTAWTQRLPLGDLASANEYSLAILHALRSGANAWLVHEGDGASGPQAGMIGVDRRGPPPHKFWRGKSYYAFRQIVNATPPGAVAIDEATSVWEGRDPTAVGSQTEYAVVRHGDALTVHVANAAPTPLAYELTWEPDPAAAGPPAALRIVGRQTGPRAEDAPLPLAETTSQDGLARLAGVVPANTLITLRLPLTQPVAPAER